MDDQTRHRFTHKSVSHSAVRRDIVILICATVGVFVISFYFNAFDIIVRHVRENPIEITYFDEALMCLLALNTGLAVFAWRRWRELKAETEERIRSQNELLRATATEAETEKIISRQLRMDMDQLKQDVREIHMSLIKKPRGA